MWNVLGASSLLNNLPCDMGLEGFLHFWTNRPAAFPAYTRTFTLFLTSSGRCSNRAANFLGIEESYYPSVGPHTRESGSANNIFPPCLYRFSTMDNKSATSANFHALNCPLFDKLFSNSAGL